MRGLNICMIKIHCIRNKMFGPKNVMCSLELAHGFYGCTWHSSIIADDEFKSFCRIRFVLVISHC